MHGLIRTTHSRWRQLRLEPLEDRRVLDAAGEVASPTASPETPWHNDVFRLDVTNDGVITTGDVLAIVNRILSPEGTGDLPVPPLTPVNLFYDTSGDNRLTTSDLLLVINGLLLRPDVELSMLATFTVDVTPQVTVKTTAFGAGQLPDGTAVLLDVDLNNDGDFSDPGEFGHSESTLYQGQSVFALTAALPRSTEVYTVRMQARVKNTEAVFGRSDALPLVVDTLTSDALANYVNAPDPSFAFSLKDEQSVSVPFLGSYTYFAFDMTSQTWRSSADVNKPEWRHWVTMYVPDGVISETAILLIDGGSNSNFTTPPGSIDLLGQAALLLGSAFVHLSVVPNEPVVFTDETESRTEDEIIAYSFDKFLNNIGEEGNDTWPVLLPMVKSAVRAMDVTQSVLPGVSDFVVTGYSKRGWTTWLTAAVDDRVRAIMPGVFDNLNQGPQMVHHFGAYGFFSEAVQPYNEMQIFDRILTPEAMHLSRIVDPYTYLANGRFDDMPKLLINSTGDEFFVSDSAQFYFDDIPGDQNYLLYIPNTGHGLDIDLGGPTGQDSKVVTSTITFADAILNNRTLPQYSWTVGQDGAIHVETDTAPLEVRLWQAHNPVVRDFRRAFYPTLTWTSELLTLTEDGDYVGNVAMPDSGARGYFVELTYANTNPSPIPLLSSPYVFTTEVRVKSPLPMHAWPFESAFDLVAPLADPLGTVATSVAGGLSAGPLSALDASAVVSALALEQDTFDPSGDVAGAVSPLVVSETSAARALSSATLLMDAPAGPHAMIADEIEEPSVSLLEDVLVELLA